MEVMLPVLTAVMAAASAMSLVSGVPSTSMDKCTQQVAKSSRWKCGFATSGPDNGQSICCNGTTWHYKNDFPCFCYYHRGNSDEATQLFLAVCGINTGGNISCSSISTWPSSNKTSRRSWNHPRALLTLPPPPTTSVSPTTSIVPDPPVSEPEPPVSNYNPDPDPPVSEPEPPTPKSEPPVLQTEPPITQYEPPDPPRTPVEPNPPTTPVEPEPPVPEKNPPPPSVPNRYTPPDSSPPPASVFPSPPVKLSPPAPKQKSPPDSHTPPAPPPLLISIQPPPPPGTPARKWPPPTTTADSPQTTSTALVVGVVSGFAGIVILILVILFVFWKRRSRTMRPHDQAPTTGEKCQNILQAVDHSANVSTQIPAHGPDRMAGASSTCAFTYEELKKATNGFSTYNILGKGGFGTVYKGILPNGTEVAAKLLKAGSWQGDNEFQTEVDIISRVHHRYLISLIGYCNEGNEKILVYAFVPNKTLEFHLHGNVQHVMEWSTRMKIAICSAKGLAYLHEDCYPSIIHRDVKAANILLDFDFKPKVADFGLAKFICDDITHVSTRVVGTFGYLAPEYAATGKLTEKSDVFSFGVILLELITGRRPVDQSPVVNNGLVEWAMPLLCRAHDDGNYDDFIDERLHRNYDPNEMSQMIACVVACLSRIAKSRPKMSQVVRRLEGEASYHSKEHSRVDSSKYSHDAASADSERTRQTASSNLTPRKNRRV